MQSVIDFPGRIEEARNWERAIFRWLVEAKQYPAIPLFEWPLDRYEGPRLYVPDGKGNSKKLLLGDIWIPMSGKKIHGAVDIKARKGFCWSDREQTRQVSIQLSQYKQYLEGRKVVKDDFWIFFFLQCDQPSPADSKKRGCPKACPSGLFAIEVLNIEKLSSHEYTHTHDTDKYISWHAPGFLQLASCDEIRRYCVMSPENLRKEPEIFDI